MKNHKRAKLSLIFVFVLATVFSGKGQVDISYSQIGDTVLVKKQNILPKKTFPDDTINRRSEELVLRPYTTDLKNLKPFLSYGWVDFDFLRESVKPLKELWKTYESSCNQKRQEYEAKSSSSQTDVMKKKIVDELLAYNGQLIDEYRDNMANFCLKPSIGLGYIPLDISLKSSATGKLKDLPDITWEVIKTMNKTPLEPYSTAIESVANLTVAYVDLSILVKNISILRSSSDIIDSFPKKDEYITNRFVTAAKPVYELIIQKIKTIIESTGESLKYDGVLLIDKNCVITTATLEQMDDITYPVYQEIFKKFADDYDVKKYYKLCEDYIKQ